MHDAERMESNGPIGRAFSVLGRVLGWSLLSAVCGVLLGFTNGVIHVPPHVPGEPLANEWYPVGVMLIMVVECVAGFLIGVGIAAVVPTPTDRQRIFVFTRAGRSSASALGGFWVGSSGSW